MTNIKAKKLILTLISALMTITILTITASARFSNTSSIYVGLSYSTTYGAQCSGSITGYTGATISDGSLVLTDSSGNILKSWTGLSSSSNTLSVAKAYSGVSKGNTYTLTISGKVTLNGESEFVSTSTTRKY